MFKYYVGITVVIFMNLGYVNMCFFCQSLPNTYDIMKTWLILKLKSQWDFINDVAISVCYRRHA